MTFELRVNHFDWRYVWRSGIPRTPGITRIHIVIWFSQYRNFIVEAQSFLEKMPEIFASIWLLTLIRNTVCISWLGAENWQFRLFSIDQILPKRRFSRFTHSELSSKLLFGSLELLLCPLSPIKKLIWCEVGNIKQIHVFCWIFWFILISRWN